MIALGSHRITSVGQALVHNCKVSVADKMSSGLDQQNLDQLPL